MQIRGCTAIVTGGGTGIGAAIAASLCAEGARVMIAGRRRAPLEETAAGLRAAGGEAAFRVTDVASPSECSALVEETASRLGPVDILVNNAGITCHGRRIEEHGAEDWDRVMNANLRSAFLLTGLVLPGMKARRRGFILMVSSESGILYFPNQVIYGLAKHGMNALAGFIQAECSPHNVHAAALCPGLTDTEMGLSLDPPVPGNLLSAAAVARWAAWLISQPDTMSVGRPVMLTTTRDPWDTGKA
jgi:NAD(P)-dependent dehydrogenase (short-subunit alcohol dehydrogenase family)